MFKKGEIKLKKKDLARASRDILLPQPAIPLLQDRYPALERCVLCSSRRRKSRLLGPQRFPTACHAVSCCIACRRTRRCNRRSIHRCFRRWRRAGRGGRSNEPEISGELYKIKKGILDMLWKYIESLKVKYILEYTPHAFT